MKKLISIVLVSAFSVMLISGCAGGNSSAPEKAPESELLSEEEQWNLVKESYEFCFPLLMEYWTMKSATNTVTAENGKAPVNQFIHAQRVASAGDKMIVTPNVDTVYTQVWMDLSGEPQVLIMPQTERYFQTQILDAWTNTTGVLGAGSYLIAEKGYTGPVPDELTLVEVPTDMVWLISRILVNGQADMVNVKEIQNDMVLEPLADNPPSDQDEAILERIKTVNVGPGLKFDSSELKGDVDKHWSDVIASFIEEIPEVGQKYGASLGVWTYYDDPIGDFGTAYDYRAVIAYSGLGANPLDVAYYCRANTDSSQEKLDGHSSYVIHFDSLPPVKEGGFWSITAYGEDNYLIDNEPGRYCVNDRSDFTFNEDGSLDIIVSSECPENEKNWLPAGDSSGILYNSIIPVTGQTAIPFLAILCSAASGGRCRESFHILF